MSESIKEVAGAGVDDEHDAFDVPADVIAQLDEFRDEDGRKIIDAKITEVLEEAADESFAGAGETGDDHQSGLFFDVIGAVFDGSFIFFVMRICLSNCSAPFLTYLAIHDIIKLVNTYK